METPQTSQSFPPDQILWHGEHGEGKLTFVLSGNPRSICNEEPLTPVVLYFFEYAGTKCEGHVHVKEPIEITFHQNFDSICAHISAHFLHVQEELMIQSAEARTHGHLQ